MLWRRALGSLQKVYVWRYFVSKNICHLIHLFSILFSNLDIENAVCLLQINKLCGNLSVNWKGCFSLYWVKNTSLLTVQKKYFFLVSFWSGNSRRTTSRNKLVVLMSVCIISWVCFSQYFHINWQKHIHIFLCTDKSLTTFWPFYSNIFICTHNTSFLTFDIFYPSKMYQFWLDIDFVHK